MLSVLDTASFFSEEEVLHLHGLDVWLDSRPAPARLAFAGLMLAPIMEIVVHDSATTAAEFEAVESYIRVLEREFELAAHDPIEAIGTEMGLLPTIGGFWKPEQFQEARFMLASALDRLPEDDARAVRGAIARAALAVARAGSSHLISLHMLDREERELIQKLIQELRLDKSSDGLSLLDKVSA